MAKRSLQTSQPVPEGAGGRLRWGSGRLLSAVLPGMALIVFLLALTLWFPTAPSGLIRVLLIFAEVALGLAAWRELSPRSLGAVLADRRALILLAVAFHLAAFAAIALFVPVANGFSIMARWLFVGTSLQAGQVPYRDFTFEYPPLSVPIFWLPVLFGHDISSYRNGFALIMLAFDLLGVGVALWARRLAPGISPWGILLLQPVWLLWAGRNLVFEDFDLAPAVLVLLAIVLLAARRHRAAWVVLGLATALKLYPAVLVPLFAIAVRRQRLSQLAEDAAAYAGAIVLPTLLIVRGDLLSVRGFFAYHLGRGLEIETSYASVLMLVHLVTGSPVQKVSGALAENVSSPQTPLLSSLAEPLTLLALAGLYLIAWRNRRSLQDPVSLFGTMVPMGMAAILIFMLAGKVLSPQYLLWLYPLVAVLGWRQATIWMLYSAALLFSGWLYPAHWLDLLFFNPQAIGVVFGRNAILLAILILVLLPPEERIEGGDDSVSQPEPALDTGV